MRIGLAQIDPIVGDFEGNIRLILEAYQRACDAGARVLLTPELGVCGYPPHDLIDRPEMIERNEKALTRLAEATRAQSCALAVGHISANPGTHGRASQNTVSILEGGKAVFRQAKTLLPTYDVFDEARYFEPADPENEVRLWECEGRKIAIAICEDLWAHDETYGRRLYGNDPVSRYRELGADAIFSLSASPYYAGKIATRRELHAKSARELGIPLIYLNQVGATDEILFDGGSFTINGQGELTGRLPSFEETFGIVELDGKEPRWLEPGAAQREDQAPSEIEVLARGLIRGIREYFERTGFRTAILGLSGGIDSAVVAALLVKALGSKNVLGVAMPSQYSSSHSLADAEALAKNLGIPFEVRPIKFLFATSARELGEARGGLAPIAQENLQARLRGLTLMTLANHYSALTVTTGNKSELATGYCTMYGDMAGALAPIGDLYKTRVYELARYINEQWGAPIPVSSIEKPPSAELRPDQKDEDSLPPYDQLDPMLEDYLENGVPVSKILLKHGEWAQKILRLVEVSEYKRRQAAPVLKVTRKAFGIGRRIPICKIWDQ